MAEEGDTPLEGKSNVRWETERYTFQPDQAVDEAEEQGDELRKVNSLFGMPTILQELWTSGLLFLTNSVLHHYGYALGVDISEGEGRNHAVGLTLHRTSDPEGIWFDEPTVRLGRQKLLAAGLLPGNGESYTQKEIEAALPALEAMLESDPKANVWALPLLLANRRNP